MNTEDASHRLSKWQPEETIEGEHEKVGAFWAAPPASVI